MAGDASVVIVPTYNERENIAVLVPRLLAIDGLRVLVVDDGSPDGTGARGRPPGRGERRPSCGDASHRPARATAARTWTACRPPCCTDATHVCQMDADLSHDPTDLRRLIARRRTRPIWSIGSRYVPGGTLVQLAAAAPVAERVRQLVRARRHRAAHPRLHQRLPVLEPRPAGAPAARRDRLRRLRLPGGDGVRGQRAGAAIVEAPITFVERRQGSSKLSWA